MPAALVEMAYLTNGEQEQRVKSDEFQGAVVEAIYGADRTVQDLSRGFADAMSRTRWLQVGGIVRVFAVAAWNRVERLERVVVPVRCLNGAAPAAPAASVPHIIATLYYGTPDGQALAAVKREVPTRRRSPGAGSPDSRE
jgi:hypothetical protein